MRSYSDILMQCRNLTRETTERGCDSVEFNLPDLRLWVRGFRIDVYHVVRAEYAQC